MSDNNSNFKIMLQAMLDKAKSIINIKSDIKNIESKLPKVKVQATLDSAKTRSELNAKLKSIRPKVKVDVDTTQAVKKIKKLGRQKIKPTVQPTVDNSQVVSGLKEAQKQTKTLWDRFISGAVGVNLVRMSVQKVTQAIYQAIAGIKELDKIKTDIQTASGVDDSKVNSMMKSYNQMAKDLSSTTKDVGNAANEIVRMGESLSDTNKLIENSTMLAKIGMIESSQATEYLISSMKGFQISAQDSTQIIDKLTSVDMQAAVSAGGLAEAMSRCSNIANNSGTSMDRLIGYMATVGEVTQDSMSVIGNAFKSMYSRMNNIKIGKFIDDETGESLSDTEAVLNKLGIQLRDTQNTYRDFDDVLDDVGNNWRNFTQVEQNAISVAIAGTMQRERFIALMNNYSNALKYSEVAANSAGSALERYGVYQDSIEAKTNELTAAIESLSMNVVSEELYSGIIQATTGLVEFLDKTNLLKGALSGLVAMGVSKAFVSISTGIISAGKSTTQLSAAMALFDKGTSVNNLKKIGQACIGLNNNQLKLVLSTKGLTNAQRLQILTGMGLEEAERQQTLATLGFASAENTATAATFSLKGVFTALKTVIATNPIGLIVTAVTAATMAFSWFKQKQEEASQALQEAISEYDSAKSSLESINSELEEQNKKMDELLSKDKLTYAEKGQLEELQAITRELLLQQDIEQRRADKASKDVAEKTIDAYQKQYGKYDKTEDDLKEMLSYDNFPLPDSTNDVLGMIAAYIRAQELLEQSQKEFDDAVKNGEDTTWLAEDVQSNIDAVNDFSQSLDENIADLHDKRTALEDEYNKAIEKQTKGIEPLTSLDKDVIETYESIHDTMKMIYEYTDPNKWNSMEMSSIFNTEGIEKTKEELVSMYKSGELASTDMLEQFPKLNQAIKESEIIAGEGSDAFKEFFNEIAALADETEDTVNGILDQSKVSLSITDTVEQLNTQLKPAFDSLQSAWKDIFTTDDNGKPLFSLDDVDLSTFDSIKSELDEMSKLGLSVDYFAFEDFVNILNNTESTASDVQDAFDSLATSITQAALSGAEDFDTMRAALEDLGVINNELVAFDALISNTEALKEAGLDLAHASDEQIAAFANEFVAAENVTQAIAMLTFHKELCNAQEMNTAGEVANLKTLAENAGYTGEVIQYLTELEQIYQEVASGTITPVQILAKTARAAMLKSYIDSAASNINYEPKVDFTKATDSAKKAGSKAGKKTADAYLEAFEKELEKLQGMRDRNEITEKEYLDNLRALYEKYFKDREKYIDEFKKYEHEYLEGLESEYKDVMNGIIKLMDKQADKYEEMKDSAVDSYNAQKDAAEDAYDAQIENIEAQIEAINDQIDAIDAEIEAKKKQADAIQDEIDKIKEAREERQKQLDLQKAQYEFQRMMNQRTILQYSEEKGMHYVADTSGAREKKEEIDEIQEEIYINGLEKQIDLINDEIDLLEERKDAFEDQIDGLEKQKDAIEKMKDTSNDYFESMIKQTETYYDKLIESLDKTKSRWEELADLKEEAEMKGKMEEILSQYGVTADDIVNMSEETFQAFKNDYLAILSDLYSGNEQMQSAIADTAGTTTDQLESYIAKTQEYIDSLISMDMSDTAASMDNTAESMDKLSTATSDANENTKAMSENMGTLSTNTAELGENASTVSDALSSIPDAEKFNVLTTSFTNLAEAIKSVADALGVSGNGTVNSLVDTLQSLSTISIDADGNGLITQFNNLKTAIEGVTNAISGGGMSGGSAGEGSPSSSPSMSAGAGGKGSAAGGLISAVEGIKNATDEALGTGGGEDGEGEGTGAIGQFEQLKDAVDDVTASIGGGGSSESGQGAGGNDGENADSLIGSIVDLGDTAEEILTGGGESEGESGGVIGRFEEFSDVIEEAKDHVMGISEGLDEIDGKEVECTIRVNIETNGSLPSVIGSGMNLGSAQYDAKYAGNAHVEGTALASGNWAVQSDEKEALVGEEGFEIIVRSGRFFTVGENGAEMFPIKKGDIVFNHQQSEELLKNGHISGRGKAYADGTVGGGKYLMPDGRISRPLQPGDRMYDMLQKFDAYFNGINRNVEKLVPNSYYDHQKQMEQMANQITNYNNVVNNTKNVQPSVNVGDINITCPGVTSYEVMREVKTQINNEVRGLRNYADQQSRIR